MSGFYKAFTTNVVQKPVIVYPCVGLEKVLRREDKDSIQSHLEKLYLENTKILSSGAYHIVILWDEASDDNSSESHDVMTDVWIFDKIESWGSGPLVDVKIFRNFDLEEGIGVSAGDGLLMLGREEELRRSSTSLQNYLFSDTRAVLPSGIETKEEFFSKI